MSHHHAVKGKHLLITIILNMVITILQTIGGLVSGSLSLLSDALHNFSDVLAIIIAYIANKFSSYPNTKNKTFGYAKAESLATLFNSIVLVAVALFLVVEAINKLYHPRIIDSFLVIILGAASIVLNSISVLLIKQDSKHSMNIKAVYLHLSTDVMTSVVVMIGGILMYYDHIFWLDSVVSMLIALYLIVSSFHLIKSSISILMEFTPESIDLDKLISTIEEFGEIDNVHHIHIWKMDESNIMLEAHIDLCNNLAANQLTGLIEQLEDKLSSQFDISHSTFQFEYLRNDSKDIIVQKNR